MNKKIKTILATSTFVLVSAASVITYAVAPLMVSSNAKSQALSVNYNFDNKTFQTKSDLFDYAKSAYFHEDQSSLNRFKWSIQDGNEIKYFSDPKLLNQYLTSFISEENLFASVDIKTNNLYNEIDAENLAHLYKDKKSTTIYRGKNNSIYTNELDAKNSYLSIHDAYYFNNLYFNNIENLKLYLKTKYYSSDSDGVGDGYNPDLKKHKLLGIKGPNGLISAGINKNDLLNFSPNASQKESVESTQELFSNFIRTNANQYLEITNSIDETKKAISYLDISSINNLSAQTLETVLPNPSYTQIKNNNGVGKYVVDLKQEDENTLFGPYYVSSPSTIKAMKNTKNWKKITSDDPLVYMNKNTDLISNFMNLFLYPDDNEKYQGENGKNYPLNISVFNTKIENYLKDLKQQNNYVYNKFLNFASIIKEGKKFNNFNSLVLFYVFLIENLVDVEAKQNIIDQTKNLFNSIAVYLDNVLKTILNPYFLKSVVPNNKDFSFESLFNFKDNKFNLDVELSYFIDQIQDKYPLLLNALILISFANGNATNSLSLVPFREDFLNARFEEQIKDGINVEKINNANKQTYQELWNLFSTSNPDDFKSKIAKNKNSTNNEQLLEQITYGITYLPQLISISSKTIFNSLIENLKTKNIDQIDLLNRKQILKLFGFSDVYNTNVLNFILQLSKSKNISAEILFALIPFFKENNFQFISEIITFLSNEANTTKDALEKIKKKNLDIDLKLYTKSIHYISSPLDILYEVLNNNSLNKYFRTKINDSISTFEYVDNTIVKGVNALNNILKSFDIKELSKNLQSLKKTIKMFATASAYLEVALVALEFIDGAFIPKTTNYSYVFEDNQNKYIWNGGFKTTMLWGLLTTDEQTIKSMKLVEPQQVTKLHINDTYYYNGKHYNPSVDFNQLRKDQLKDMLIGEYKADDVTRFFSFDNLNLNTNYSQRPNFLFESLGDIKTNNTLINYVFNKIKDDLNLGINATKKYYVTKYSFANGLVTTDLTQAKDVLVENVVSKIKPVKIALLPKLATNSRYPISLDTDEIDDSLDPYQLPGTSWSFSGQSVNKTDKKYIIIDPNIDSKNKPYFSIKDSVQNNMPPTSIEAVEKLKMAFYNYFDVESKNVLSYELVNNNLYSTINKNIILHYVYKAEVKNKQTKYFLNKVDAFNYLLNVSDFKVYEYTETNEVYKYQDQIFNSRVEFLEFVLEAAKTEGGK